jgi:transcriptional regulator with XRE-family HTH domain
MTEGAHERVAIAARLRMARELAGLSQAQVAKMLGLHRPSVSEAEAGRRRVTAEELVRMADMYGVDIAWLAGAEDDGSSPEAARVGLAARELSKLKPEDLGRLLQLLQAMRKGGDKK